MRHKKLFSSIAFIFIAFLSLEYVGGQTDKVGSVTGQVTEKFSGQPIQGVAVEAGDFKGTTDQNGRYKIDVPAGVYSISFRMKGFADVISAQITVTSSRTTVLNMPLAIEIEGVTVDIESSTFETTSELPLSQTVLNRDEIRSAPGSGGDPLRALNSLPSITVESGEFADLIVRGGSTGENLTFIDNIPVSDFTLFTDKYDGGRSGRATFLPPDVFSKVEFSAGGFGVRYGDRMSSVMDVTLRESNRERLQGSFFVDSGGAGVSIDTPLGKRGGILTSVRRSYIDVAFDIFNIADIGRPRNWDIINRGIYQINERNKLTVTALTLFERYTLDDEQAANSDRTRDRLRTERRSKRAIFGTTLHTTIGDNSLSRITFWGNLRESDGALYRPFTTLLQRSRNLKDSEFGIKEEFSSVVNSRTQLFAGVGLIFSKSDYFSYEKSGLGFSPFEEEYLAPTRESRFNTGWRASSYAYAQLAFNVTNRLTVSPQIRVDRYGLSKETVISPRVSARYSISDKISANFAAGIYRQLPDVFDFTLAPNNSLKSQRADHYIGGIEFLASRDVRIRAEVFEKRYSAIVIRQYGGVTALNNNGQGQARGVEISAQKSLTGNFSGQLSYSFVQSRRELCANCGLFPADIERPHQLVIVGITRVKGFTLGAKYRLASGLPYSTRTPVTIAPDTFVHRIQSIGDINANRLPRYSSFDVRVERKFDFRKWSIAPFFDLFNVFATSEGTEINYEFERPSAQLINEGTRLPIFGLRIEF